MRILITGGAGFIGSHFCDRYLTAGHHVIAMDNLKTGTTDNIAHLAGHPRFLFVYHDVTHYIYVAGAVDMVLHLASLPSPVDYLNYPIQTLKVGALGTHNTLGLALAKGARYLLASTSEVYGDPLVHPQDESYWGNVNPIGPRGVYDESKRFAEALTMAYDRYHDVDTRIVRIFNTYGPRMRADDGRVVPNFINQALRGEPLTVYDHGRRTRAFCFVDDLVDGIVRLMESEVEGPVNIGNPTEISIEEFAKLVIEVAESASTLSYVIPGDERTRDDPKQRCPDITRARELLGWEPRVPLRDGLERTAAYFRQKMAAG